LTGRFAHLIDPRTGVGSMRRIGVMVVASDGAIADGLGTALYLSDPAGARRLLEAFPEAKVTLVEYGAAGGVLIGVEDLPPREYGWSAHNEPPPGFEALFDGKSLEGWQGLAGDPPVVAKMSAEERAKARRAADAVMRRHWRVEDGALRFDGGGANLQTAREFGDFELLLDWKIEPKGDSGVYLRGVPQVQIWDDPVGSGGLYNNQRGPSKPMSVADRPAGEWNRFRIVMRGERVWVWLNGVPVVKDVVLENYWDRGQPVPARGPIELQAHGTELWFRNVFVREDP
jgi:hypothetical protein